MEEIPHFATVSYAFCKRFPEELTEEIFAHILNKALNHRMVDPKMIFMDGTHIKASANKKKFQKEKVAKVAKVYAEQLREEVNAEREKLGKKPIEDDDDSRPGGETVERTVSTTDPESGMFVEGDHERQFAYEAHTACDRKGFINALIASVVLDTVGIEIDNQVYVDRFGCVIGDRVSISISEQNYSFIINCFLLSSKIPILTLSPEKFASTRLKHR